MLYSFLFDDLTLTLLTRNHYFGICWNLINDDNPTFRVSVGAIVLMTHAAFKVIEKLNIYNMLRNENELK